MPEGKLQQIKGFIEIDKAIPSFSNAVLHIYVENTELLDTDAILLSSREYLSVSHRTGISTAIPYSISFYSLGSYLSRLIVRAHISLTKQKEIKTGDLISTQAYPILENGLDQTVLIRVQVVE